MQAVPLHFRLGLLTSAGRTARVIDTGVALRQAEVLRRGPKLRAGASRCPMARHMALPAALVRNAAYPLRRPIRNACVAAVNGQTKIRFCLSAEAAPISDTATIIAPDCACVRTESATPLWPVGGFVPGDRFRGGPSKRHHFRQRHPRPDQRCADTGFQPRLKHRGSTGPWQTRHHRHRFRRRQCDLCRDRARVTEILITPQATLAAKAKTAVPLVRPIQTARLLPNQRQAARLH